MRKAASFICVFLGLGSAALGQSSKVMDVVDFLVDRPTLVGKTVTVKGCRVSGASAQVVFCYGPGTSGYFYIDGDSLEKESLRKSLRSCAHYDDTPDCHADVTGDVETVLLELGLKNATLKWIRK